MFVLVGGAEDAKAATLAHNHFSLLPLIQTLKNLNFVQQLIAGKMGQIWGRIYKMGPETCALCHFSRKGSHL